MFSKSKIFSDENILRKGKHFLLFDCVVEITPENFFLCLILDVKKSIFRKRKPKPSIGHHDQGQTQPITIHTKSKSGRGKKPPPLLRYHHHKKSTTIHKKPTKTPPPIPHKNHHPHHHNNNKIKD